MPAYLIRQPGRPIEDVVVADPHLTLSFTNGWATLRDEQGICLAIPAHAGAHIQRVDDIGVEDQELAPTKE
ncbi:hypothetical protein [Streptomyces sp. NBC_01789]|uniref:hypothetical protein n=1 Tax=Streptomyces sp. NBC_01789 TaxID=2975941 RepID=UPI00225B5AEF|nr:hypothetical protein [Streptomyces sp. NBC_01789]MCX4450701.1 hypothetical protein [Streptomyces sp. NBC_01789]